MEQQLYELPEGWQRKSLGELLNVQNGYAFDSKKFSEQEGVPLIRIRDLKSGVETETNFTGEYKQQYVVCAGDYLIGMDGEFRCYRWKGAEALLNQRVCRLQDFSRELNPDFIFYGINDHLRKIEENTAFVTVKHISAKQIKAIEFNFPPLNEQKRIVAKLDALFTRIDAAITHLQETLELSKALLASALSTGFRPKGESWQKVNLADVCGITSKLSDPREPEFIDMTHVGGANIESLTGELTELKTAREEKLISGKYPFNECMVLYSKIRPYLMKVARPNFQGLCSADIYPLNPKSDVLNRDFLFYLLLTEDFTSYANQGSSRAGMPKVNRKHLFNYQFLLPTIDEQREIVTHLDALAEHTSTLEAETQERLDQLTALKSSLLDSAFRGQL
jgi:type I restriction enzyme S subunit